MNPALYGQLADTATSQAANYYGEGKAAQNVAAPTIAVQGGAATRGQLAGVQRNYGALDQGIASTIAGHGPQAGAAVNQQGTDASISSMLGGAAGARGGNPIAAQRAAMGAGASAGLSVASNAASAQQQQTAGAQGQLAGNLNSQSGLALSQQQIQQKQAIEQAQLRQQQQAQNTQNAQNLFGQSAAEQNDYTQAVNNYIEQGQAAQQQGVNAQKQDNQQSSSVWGDIGSGIGDVASIAAFL
jgi:hypothetical protein